MKTLKYLLCIVILAVQTLFSQDFWESTGGPYGPGYISAINANPSGEIYVGIDDIGLYRSTDNGTSFIYLSNSLSNTSIRSIVVNQNGHIFIGDAMWPGKGVLKSTDEGNSWMSVLIQPQIQAMTIDPDNFIFVGSRFDGLYRSSDNGNSWVQLNLNPMLETIMSLTSNSSGHLFISGFIDGWSPPRTMRSTNKGESWDTLNIPNGYISNFTFSNDGLIVSSFHPTDPDDSSAFFISTDNGNLWTRKNIVRSYYGINNLVFDSPSNSFYAVVYDYNHTYDWDILKSTDLGNTWTTISTLPYNQPDLFSLSNNQAGYLYVGDWNGLKHSTDFGYNWNQSDSGFFATQVNYLTLLLNDRIYCGTRNGNFHLNNDKMSWAKDSIPVGSLLISNSGNYFISSSGLIKKSIDNGITWMIVFDPTIYDGATIELTKLSNGYLFASGVYYSIVHGTGFSVIWRSTDDGLTWDDVYGYAYDDIMYTITTTPDDILLAGGRSSGHRIIRSTDFGDTWVLSNSGLPSDANCTIIRAKSNDMIFAGTSNYGIFRSTDGGASWNDMNNGLSSLKITSIVINSIGKIYIGTPNGVFISFDNGNNWYPRNIGLLDVEINSLLLDSLEYLYAATNGCGVFRSVLSTTSVKTSMPIVSKFHLSQNFPNPFNPTTIIKYTIPSVTLRQAQSDNWVTLKVYDVLGNEIATLVNEEKQPGNYEVEFNPVSGIRNLASGIYFYQLKVGNPESNSGQVFVETKKMLLLK
jgi:photosystem II stability/assembly factor-like uncharacterized protein